MSLVFDENCNLGQFYEEIDPPKKMRKHIYRCHNHFYLDILYEIIESYETFGIILLSGDESRLYTVNGENYKLLFAMRYNCPNKQSHGGWSQQRFDRLRLEKINEYYKKVLEKIKFYYIDKITDQPNIKGLIFAGPAQTKFKIANHEMFDYRLKKMILGIETTFEINDYTIHEIIKKSSNLLTFEDPIIKNTIEKFSAAIRNDNGLAVYGSNEVKKCLENNLLQYLIIAQSYFDKNNEKFDDICKKNGCQIIITGSSLIENYGGLAGLTWYPISWQNGGD